MQYKKEFFGTLAIGLILMGGYFGYDAWAKSSAESKLAADTVKLKEAAGTGATPNFQAARDLVESGAVSRDAIQNVMQQRMEETMDTYFALPEGPQRLKYMDEQIDMMQRMRGMWQRGGTTRPAGERRGDRATTGPSDQQQRDQQRGEFRERMQTRMDSMPPARRAQAAEFRAAMRARMEARGIQPGGSGGGRGPGGGGGGGGGGSR